MTNAARWLALFLLAVGTGGAQESTDKQELRCKFKQGEKFTIRLLQKMGLKLEQIPEQYREMFGDEPFDLDLSGTLTLEVKTVAENGSATLDAKFQKLKAKGHALANEIDYDYDADKPRDKKPDEGNDPGTPGGIDPAQLLEKLATQTLVLKADPRGKFEIQSDTGMTNEMMNEFFNLNGLMGELPKEKVGAGDSWKSKQTLMLPGIEQFKIRIRAENTVEKFATVKGEQVATVKTKLTIGTLADEKDEPEGSLYNLKTKMTGEGSGTTQFSVDAGRARNAKNQATVKVTVTMDNPEGGDAIEFKGTLKIEQEHQTVE